jgi:membrane protease YdiL (CAAX protease family)
VWAAAAIPMAVLAWVIAPLLGALLGGGDVAFIKVLVLCITVGLIWQFVLTLILTRREQGTFRWSRVRDALWLLPPRDPRSGRVGGRVWLWAIPFFLLFVLWEFFGISIPGPSNKDLTVFLPSERGQEFFSGARGWYAVVVVLQIFNSALGEELLFLGLLLPRMRGVFGRGDFVANGVLFAFYHLHTPWSIPPPWRTSSISPIPRGGGRARGWRSSSTRVRASSSSSSSSASCLADLRTHALPTLSVASYSDGLFTLLPRETVWKLRIGLDLGC